MWNAKQQIIGSLTETLWDVHNYGLFQPAGEGRDAKFLEEERTLQEYSQSFEKGVPYLEVGNKCLRPGKKKCVQRVPLENLRVVDNLPNSPPCKLQTSFP